MSMKVRFVFTENPWAKDSGIARHVTGPYDHAICNANGRILGMDDEHNGKRDQITLIAEVMVALVNSGRGKVPLYEVGMPDKTTVYFESMIITEESNIAIEAAV